MSLSDKRFDSVLMKDGSIPVFRNPRYLYDEKNVKKAIKELKGSLPISMTPHTMEMMWKTIDKVFGDKLT